ncbi:MAG: DUF1844 domain-containing protein [Planctomycetota bacterium]|nr:MAG: DUF1844 domain-containing protein [Planctomycetota bacterium]
MEKKVDHSWKERVQSEKRKAEQAAQQDFSSEPSFLQFISALSAQAMGHLGIFSEKGERDLIQAKYLIDILGILEEKTKNNLTQEEESFLKQMLHQLRMAFVEASARGVQDVGKGGS